MLQQGKYYFALKTALWSPFLGKKGFLLFRHHFGLSVGEKLGVVFFGHTALSFDTNAEHTKYHEIDTPLQGPQVLPQEIKFKDKSWIILQNNGAYITFFVGFPQTLKVCDTL